MGYLTCGQLDLRDVPESEKIVSANNSEAWLKADVSEKIYYYGGFPCCVVTVGQAVYGTMCNSNNAPAVVNQMTTVGTRRYREGGNNSSGGTSTASSSDAEQASTGVDVTSMNKFGFMPTCVLPQSVTIPMRSNLIVYGPYVSSNWGATGGTNIEKDSDLCPWAFGGYAGMNAAGTEIANSSTIGLVKAETGSATIPGFPSSNLTYLGAILGSGGPTLTDMNFSYGSTGVTTSYNFKTFTPKTLAGVSRSMIDRVKSISKYRADQIKFLRSQQIDMNKIGRKLSKYASGTGSNTISNRSQQARGSRSSNSLQRMLVGESAEWEPLSNGSSSRRIVVGTVDLNKSGAEMREDFGSKAYMSLDAFFVPVSKYGDGGLSPYAGYSKISSNRPLRAIPPIGKDEDNADTLDQYALAVNRKYYDPLTGVGDDAHTRNGTASSGHTIDYAASGSELPTKGILSSFKKATDPTRYASDYRFFALRGPLVLQQWGYDTDGKPIPNASDTDGGASNGSFTTSDLKDEFLDHFLAKPQTWPVAPVDLRFDRERGVWTCAPEYQLLIVQFTEKLSPLGKAKAKVSSIRGKPFYDQYGEEINEPHIEVHDKLGVSIDEGKKCFAYYDPNEDKYYALSATGGGGAIRFKGFVIDKTNGTGYGDNWAEASGFGDRKPGATNFYGVRIAENGALINANGKTITPADMRNAWNNPSAEESQGVFVRLHCLSGEAKSNGNWGASFGYWGPGDTSSDTIWQNYALNGCAVEIDAPVSPDGTPSTSDTMPQYEVVFMESYATFVRGELLQDLYVPEEESSKYNQDEYKSQNLDGNSSLVVDEFWGPSGNRNRPQFYDSGMKPLPLRVFDPYLGETDSKYKTLKQGDKVLAVFNDNNKKYYIIDANSNNDTKLVKFGLAQDWYSRGYPETTFRAVRLDYNNTPVDESGQIISDSSDIPSQDTIRVYDPRLQFGPAAGSTTLADFSNRMSDGNGNKSYFPFIGFALQTVDAEGSPHYECVWLQSFAKSIGGICGSLEPISVGGEGDYYIGEFVDFAGGTRPCGTSMPQNMPAGVYVSKIIPDSNGGDYFCGTLDSSGEHAIGCRFVGELLPEASVNGKLVYGVVEHEPLARKMILQIRGEGTSEAILKKLNTVGYANMDPPYMHPVPLQGFFWPDANSELVTKSKIYNKDIWTGRRLLLESTLNIRCELTGYNPADGTSEYTIVDAPVIAGSSYGYIGTSHRTGIPASTKDVQAGALSGINKETYNIKSFGAFYYADGQSPANLDDMYIHASRTWMTFSASRIACLYSDVADPSGSFGTLETDGHYRIIDANEAPVIITAKANQRILPNDRRPSVHPIDTFITLDTDVAPNIKCYSSCYKGTVLLGNNLRVFNPLKFGAHAGGTVTLQRVCLDETRFEGTSYVYIIIGTSDSP